jgi:probable rRNA maturation factor
MRTSEPTGRVGTVAEVHGADEQDDVSIDLDGLVALAEAVLEAEGTPANAEVSLVMIPVDEMAELNEAHRGKAGPTDVLSFTIDDEVVEGPAGSVVLLGDIAICPAVAAANAVDHEVSVEAELELLVVHGCLHLLGWDHEVEAEAEAMEAREVEHLGRFGRSADRAR